MQQLQMAHFASRCADDSRFWLCSGEKVDFWRRSRISYHYDILKCPMTEAFSCVNALLDPMHCSVCVLIMPEHVFGTRGPRGIPTATDLVCRALLPRACLSSTHLRKNQRTSLFGFAFYRSMTSRWYRASGPVALEFRYGSLITTANACT